MRALILLACLLACGATPAQEYQCGQAGAKIKPAKPEVITLNREARKTPAFYAHVGRYVIFFKPEDVLEAARARERYWTENNFPAYARQQAGFIASLSADLPLKEHADFYKYSLRDKFYKPAAEGVIDLLLEQGRASVGEWQHFDDALDSDRADAKFILRASTFSGSEETSREYCAADGTVLFGALYVIN